ncbi:MAG: tetraacyldisaccharide 4'-kinase, partial [Muribaculaceae bacterium]|nr:tetraacyldisaccharide 4'-kinase [Muribaculaceae bacterium]
ILAVCGIGNPRPFVDYLRSFDAHVKVKLFSDHHYYNRHDFEAIESRFDRLDGNRKMIITTEKDAVRMLSCSDFPEKLKPYIYFVPIEVKFVGLEGESFDETLNKLIRNSNVAVKK